MDFETASAPQWRAPATVGAMMRTVLYALAPALLAHLWFYGIGIVLNTAIAVLFALLAEALALRLLGKPLAPFLGDGSALVTAVLFAFCLPPLCPWWVTATGTVFAIGFAKHLYGGLGFNLFNPAMAGYALVLVSFPGALTAWPGPDIGVLDMLRPDSAATLQYWAGGRLPAGLDMDAIARATTLDSAREGLAMMRTMDEIRTNPVFGDFGGAGWEWIGNFVAIGGFVLLVRGVIRWHVPAAVLAGLLVPATLVWLLDASTHPSPGFHLFSGGAMLGAFFIATDPVSSPATPRGRLLFGAGIGMLTFVIREWGSYADGVAFAVLLMNMTVPLIDRYTRPRVYGRPA
ncbi:MAG: RnfABCDGE type electron transport complex subunit D [Gammaproteobacteria bacterium]|nr:RnfABCDGE type electron transport complex subunit D [Gammaproteobacteria bacterium]